MFTPDVRLQNVLFSPLACLIVIGAAYICQSLSKAASHSREKRIIMKKKSELWLFNNAAHFQSGSQTDPHFHVIPPFGLLKFDFIILLCRVCPARLCYIDAIKNVCVFSPPFNVISILRRHWSAGAPPQPKHLWKSLLLSLKMYDQLYAFFIWWGEKVGPH